MISNRTEILHLQIASLFSQHMNLDVPSFDFDLLETGALDSLSLVELLVHLEKEFDIKVNVEELEIDDFCSIQAIADFILKLKMPKEVAAEGRTWPQS